MNYADARLLRLAERARAGDADALLRLADALRRPVFGQAYALLADYDDAQDVVAPVLLRVCRGVRRLRSPEGFGAWVRRIVRNESLRVAAARRRGATADVEEQGPKVLPPDDLRMDLERALRRLPRDQARAIWLCHFGGRSVAEIAAELGAPEGTVKYWLHRARRRLAEELEGYEPMNVDNWPAVIVHGGHAPEESAALSDALRRAGWGSVRFVTGFVEASRLLRAEEAQAADTAGHRLIVVDGSAGGGHSAFELFPLWNASPQRARTHVFLLAPGGEAEGEFDAVAMSAYLSGVDFLLTKPYEVAEVESFARRAKETLVSAG